MLDILRENASGEWCVLWDADCWYHHSVVTRHMQVAAMDTAVMFRGITCYSLAQHRAYVVSDERAIHGSFFRMTHFDFTKPFYRQTDRLKILDAPSNLVIKFVNEIT